MRRASRGKEMMVIPWSFESNKGCFSSALEHWVVSGVDNRDDLGS